MLLNNHKGVIMADDIANLNFDSPDPIRLPVKIGQKELILREASTDVAVRYRNASTRAAKMVDGKLVGVDGVAEVLPILVQGCLFEVVTIGNARTERQVLMTYVRDLPYRIVKPLFDKAKSISKGLEDTPTLESLDEQIADLQKQRADLAALTPEQVEGGEGKDLLTSTPNSSA